jgi:glycosyltransferase involved in cell wall biosynthesis
LRSLWAILNEFCIFSLGIGKKKMKIAYVTTYDSSDINQWSGLGTNIKKALENSGFQIEAIGNLRKKHHPLRKIKEMMYGRVFRKGYLWEREPRLLKNYAAQVENALASISFDVIFSPGTLPIAYLQTRKPIVIWSGSTFAGARDFYPNFSNLCAESIKNGNIAEQMALSKCRLAIFSSEWAADSAIKFYNVDRKKVRIVPWGANIICNRNVQDINSIIKNKNYDICKLLFVGLDWNRKGGALAVNVADQLNQKGIKTELHVIGCNPEGSLPAFVKLHGFISKKNEEGRISFDKLMSESHFFILPSKAEMFGVVFAEASSFGLPSLATRVGGIPSAIHDGINGQTFPLNEGPEEYCAYIEKLMSSRKEYEKLAMSSFREYSGRLNWASSGRNAYELIQEFCG